MNYDYNFWAGMESIGVQRKSPLAEEMIAFFKEIMDYRDELNDKKLHNTKVTHLVAARFRSTRGKLAEIIFKHCKLRINAFNTSSNPDGGFAVNITMNDHIEFYKALKRYTGQFSGDPKMQPSDDFQELSNHIDPNNSKIIGTTYSKNKVAISCTMHFDPYMAFLMKEVVHKKFDYMTAEQLTGIILHEIGHAFTMVERAAHNYMTISRVSNWMNFDPKTITKADLTKKLKQLKPAIDNLKNNKNVPEPIQKGVVGAYDVMTSMLENLFDNSFGTVFLFGLQIFATIMNVVHMFMTMTQLGTYMMSEIVTIDKLFNERKGKTGDLAYSRKNVSFNERLADEFAARHGLGGDMVLGLNLIIKASMFIGATMGATCLNTSLRNSNAFYCLTQLSAMCYTTAMAFMPIGTYESQFMRIKRMLENNLVALSEDLPPERMDDFIKQYEKNLEAIKEVPNASKVAEKLWRLFGDCNFINLIFLSMRNGKLCKELEVLSDSTEAIIANKAHYYGAKFDQLARRA